MISRKSLILTSRSPPYPSVRLLVSGERNWPTIVPVEAWYSTISNPASLARRVPSAKSRMNSSISSRVIGRGGLASRLREKMTSDRLTSSSSIEKASYTPLNHT